MLLLSLGVPTTAAERESDRTRELLKYTCSSSFGEHELTLFANGTLRLWEGAADERTMSLAELTPDELRAYVERLSRKPYDRSQQSNAGGPSGEWVEQCSLHLTLASHEPLEFRFSRVENLSLDLSHLLTIADELLAETKARGTGGGFPNGYVPQPGDILVHKDGSRYRIERFTGDGGGFEISGIESPLVMYIRIDAVIGEFAGLAERAVGQ